MTGADLLRRLALEPPPVESGAPRAPLSGLLGGLTSDLAAAVREALSAGDAELLVPWLDRVHLWPGMASGLAVAAEVAAHLLTTTTTEPPPRASPSPAVASRQPLPSRPQPRSGFDAPLSLPPITGS